MASRIVIFDIEYFLKEPAYLIGKNKNPRYDKDRERRERERIGD